jgi:hypothetical protein
VDSMMSLMLIVTVQKRDRWIITTIPLLGPLQLSSTRIWTSRLQVDLVDTHRHHQLR